MERPKFTLWLLLLGFFFIDFTRSMLLPNIVTISHLYFGSFQAIEIGLLVTAQMGASAVACLVFGILADKKARKNMVVIALTFWLSGLSLIILAFITNYYILLVGQLLLGFGSGGFIPVVQAIIRDATPAEKQGRVYGWSSILWSLGFSGIVVGSMFSPNWQLPFIIAIIPLAALTILYLMLGTSFKIGRHEEELKEVFAKDKIYNYRVNWESFKGILRNKTNILVFIEGISSVFGVSMIILYFFPFLEEGPANISPFIVGLLMLLIIFPIDFVGILLWGKVGDKLVVKYPRIRILLIALCFTISVPLFIITFNVQGSPAAETTTLFAAFTNPGILAFVLLFAIGEFFLVIYSPNQPPIINAINLPETQGSVFALNRFVEELGGSLGPLVIGLIFEATAQDYSLAMTLGMMFMIPGTICWWIIMKTYLGDRASVQKTLGERARHVNNTDQR